jgi:hypothetical protein
MARDKTMAVRNGNLITWEVVQLMQRFTCVESAFSPNYQYGNLMIERGRNADIRTVCGTLHGSDPELVSLPDRCNWYAFDCDGELLPEASIQELVPVPELSETGTSEEDST